MRCLSMGGRLFTAVAIIVGAVEIARGNPAPPANGLDPRQNGLSSNPETSKFLRRTGGVVTVMGNRIYYDGGLISQQDVLDGRLFHPTNATLSIDLSSSWSPATVSISEYRRPNSPTMEFQTILTDQDSKCFYVWGGYSAFNISVPNPPQFWRFCDNGGNDRGAWEEVKLPSVSEFRQLTNMAFAAFASTPDAGFVFGGRSYRSGPGDGIESSDRYLSFNFTTLTWEWHDTPKPTYSYDQTLWGSKAIYVPNYGPNGLIFILGGMRGRDTGGATYLDFRTLHFLDPVTREWYKQVTTTTDGFPGTRHQHCIAGLAGANNTYEIYMFGGATDEKKVENGYNSMYVLSLPSFTWTLAGRVSDRFIREGHSCAIVGNSQLLTWGGLPMGTQEEAFRSRDPFPQGLAIYDLNTLAWTNRYNADAAPYRAHNKIVLARAAPVQWSSPEVSAFFDARDVVMESPGAQPQDEDEDDSKASPTPVGAIVGGVVGGVVLIAMAAAAIWFIASRRRRTKSPDVQEQKAAGVKTQYEVVPGSMSLKYPTELHGHSRPTEMMS